MDYFVKQKLDSWGEFGGRKRRLRVEILLNYSETEELDSLKREEGMDGFIS